MDFLAHWRDKRVLVTGGTGFIGRHVLRLGQEAGVQLYNLSSTAQAPIRGVNYHQVDLRDVTRVRDAISTIRPHGILHLAAGGVTRYPQADVRDLLEINAMGLETLLQAASQLAEPPSLVIAGSWFEYQQQNRPLIEKDPVWVWSSYTASKRAANAIAEFYAQQLPICLLRVFSVYGPGESFPRLAPSIIRAAQNNDKISLTACEQVRDYVYVEDVARAFWYALNHQYTANKLEIYNVGSGKPLVLRTFVEKLAKILQTHGLVPHVEFGAKPYRENEAMFAVANIDRIQTNLAWRPAVSLDYGLKRMVNIQLGVEK